MNVKQRLTRIILHNEPTSILATSVPDAKASPAPTDSTRQTEETAHQIYPLISSMQTWTQGSIIIYVAT